METYQPLFQLTSRLATPALLKAAHADRLSLSSGKEGSAPASAAGDAAAEEAAEEAADIEEAEVIGEVEQFVTPALSQQTLRLLLALVSGHEQVFCCFL